MEELVERKGGDVAQSVDIAAKCAEWLRATGTRLTDTQMEQFIEMAVAYRLNPAKREIYAVAYGNNFNVIVGYETYIKRAERTGLLDGWTCTCDGETARCEIYRKNWSRPFVHEVEMAEYNTGKSLWVTKPRTMLKKVAIAQAFRLCFSDDLGGMPYTSEEMNAASEPINVTPTVPKVEQFQDADGKVEKNTRNWAPTKEMIGRLRSALARLKELTGCDDDTFKIKYGMRYNFVCNETDNIDHFNKFLAEVECLVEEHEAAKTEGGAE